MSLCPGCQQEPRQPDFCEGCFRELQPAAPGRFAGLLAQSFSSPSPQPQAPVGPDLLAVQFQPTTWNQRVLVPRLKRLVPGALALSILLGLVAYQNQRAYQQSLQHRRNGIALTAQGDYQAAHSQLDQAPEDSDTYLARAQLAMAEGQWEQAAEQLRKCGKTDALVDQNVDRVSIQRAQEMMKTARPMADHAQALGLCDRAQILLSQHHARPTQLAQVHFLRAQIFQKMALVGESIQELRVTLQLDSAHKPARSLLSQLSPPPRLQPPVAHVAPAPVPKPESSVQIPQIQMQPDYPTYQPPEEDEEEETGSGFSQRSTRSDSRKSRKGEFSRRR